MSTINTMFQKIFLTLLVGGSLWIVFLPSPTLAAEDHYKIPGWVCKPSNRLLQYPAPPGAPAPNVVYARGANIVNNDRVREQVIVCPLHLKKDISRIKKVLVDYTDNHPQDKVRCTLHVLGKTSREEFQRAESPSGQKKGFLSLTSRISSNKAWSYTLECTLPKRTNSGISSIDAIHVYQDKLEGDSIGGPLGSFSQGGSKSASMPGVACHPLAERPGKRYAYNAEQGTLENHGPVRGLEVVCPIVRDNTKTKKSSYVEIQMYNLNPRSRFQATCSTWVTNSSGRQRIPMRWKDSNRGGLGWFTTTRQVSINSSDTFSVICSIPPAKRPNSECDHPDVLLSGIRMVRWNEEWDR